MARDLDGRKFTYALLVTYVVWKQNAYMARDLDDIKWNFRYLRGIYRLCLCFGGGSKCIHG